MRLARAATAQCAPGGSTQPSIFSAEHHLASAAKWLTNTNWRRTSCKLAIIGRRHFGERRRQIWAKSAAARAVA